jgi:uncharacterized iron-regulated protein
MNVQAQDRRRVRHGPIASRRAVIAACAALLAACAGPRPASGPVDGPRGVDAAIDLSEVPSRLRAAFLSPRPPDVLMLGEVHDNARHHEARLAWLRMLATERRFALAMEQLDSDHQDAIDAARRSAAANGMPLEARTLADAGRFDARGWSWAHYGPFIAFALRENLPLVAANLSSAQTARIARGQATAAIEPAGWSDGDESAMAGDIRDGHCGLLPDRAIPPMARAQRSRDAHIAARLIAARRATGLPVVLIAGNGHVRTDLGVPRHLRAAQPPVRVLSLGLLEAPAPEDARRFDIVVRTPAQDREDPCEGLRARMGALPARKAP